MQYLNSSKSVGDQMLTKYAKHSAFLDYTLVKRNIIDYERRSKKSTIENLSWNLTSGVKRTFAEESSYSNQFPNSGSWRSPSQLAMRTLSASNAESFFFRDKDGSTCEKAANDSTNSLQMETSLEVPSTLTPFCLLCREYLEPPYNKRLHIACANRSSHTNHICREVSLDSLAALAVRGYPIDHIYEVWSDALYHNEAFFRIKSFVSPAWCIEERAEILSQLLLFLKDLQVIDLCLAGVTPEQVTTSEASYHNRRRTAFERLEYIGDNAWGTHISSRMMIIYPDQKWQYSERPLTFNCFRDACEMNVMLDIMFDVLHLKRLHPSYDGTRIGSGKVKADIVEALIGELHVNAWGLEPQIHDDSPFLEINNLQASHVLALIKHCLTEIYDLIVLWYSRDLSCNAQPLAKDLAVRHIWKRVIPSIQSYKMCISHAKRRTVVECVDFPPSDSMADLHHSEKDSRELSLLSPVEPFQKVNLRSIPSIRLPALPKLLHFSHPCPENLMHPLLKMTLEEHRDSTLSEHIKEDAFTFLHQSFERLGLLSNKPSGLLNCVGHLGPNSMSHNLPVLQWQKYISQLIPHITGRSVSKSFTNMKDAMLAVMHAGEIHFSSLNTLVQQKNGSEKGNESLMNFANTSTLSTDSIFPDGGYDEHLKESYHNFNHFTMSVTNADALNLCHFLPQCDSPQLPLSAKLRSGHKNDIKVSIKAKEITEKGPRLPSSVYPRLIPALLLDGVDEDCNAKNQHESKITYILSPSSRPLGMNSQSKSSTKLCIFYRSKYFPTGIKPPVSGVITDKNLHFGQYALLAYRKCDSSCSSSLVEGANFHTMATDLSEASHNKRTSTLKFNQFDANAGTIHAEKSVPEKKNGNVPSEEEEIERIDRHSCTKRKDYSHSTKELSEFELARTYWTKLAQARRLEIKTFF